MTSRTVLFFVIAVFAGCTSSENKALEAIKQKESTLYSEDTKNFKFDEKQARETIAAYEDFAQKFPESKQTPEMLLKAADLHRSVKEYDLALNLYKTIETQYPDFEKMAQVIFLEGFVYENELFKLEKAKERYELFLKNYPDHELADDVRFSLQNLGKSPEEIIKGFERETEVANDSTPS